MKKIIEIFFRILAVISLFLLVTGKDLFSMLFGEFYLRFWGGLFLYFVCIFNILLAAFVLNKIGVFERYKKHEKD